MLPLSGACTLLAGCAALHGHQSSATTAGHHAQSVTIYECLRHSHAEVTAASSSRWRMTTIGILWGHVLRDTSTMDCSMNRYC